MLKISANGRYIVNAAGKLFPYLADTAWTMLQRLSREEIIEYLGIRSTQGFNAVQVSAVSELDGLRRPNREGELPFIDGDPAKPNEKYFALVAFLLREAARRGMVVTLLPTWGDKFNQKWGIGPEVFTPENAFSYGCWLGTFAGHFDNLIWMLGGDRPIENERHRAIIDAMAEGLRRGEGTAGKKHLMTYHPCGEASSADFLKGCGYLDFHSVQSGHAFGGWNSHHFVERTLKADNKPCLDAECFYEDFPADFCLDWGYRWTAADIRRRIYSNLVSGSLGHTYGHQSVWRFQEERDKEYPYRWKEALHRPMALQVKHVNKLISFIDLLSLRPGAVSANCLSAVGDDYLLIYPTRYRRVFVDVQQHFPCVQAQWYDTSCGIILESREDYRGKCVFTPPNPNGDYILLLWAK
ncbi:MAG TPA: DUF4038 domain-containing protein [Firmicutes bacterium]|nr:DUF4038 domain-containing protein [Bacillota bacterium]